MDLEDLEAALAELLPGCSIETDNHGQVIIYTGLREDEDGQLIDFDSEESSDSLFDLDVSPLEDEESDN